MIPFQAVPGRALIAAAVRRSSISRKPSLMDSRRLEEQLIFALEMLVEAAVGEPGILHLG